MLSTHEFGKAGSQRGREGKKERRDTKERKKKEKAKTFVLQCLAQNIKLKESEIPFCVSNNRCSEKYGTLRVYSVDRRS